MSRLIVNKIVFYKYHGCGNDFIILDGRNISLQLTPHQINALCERHFGIGSDGLLILEDSDDADFRMIFFNPDGSRATFCGNGGRCISAFAQKLGVINDKCTFIADDGTHHAEIIKNNANTAVVKLSMNDVLKEKNVEGGFLLNTGTEHFVKYIDNINDFNLNEYGFTMHNNPAMGSKGANINIAEIDANQQINVRTYEKGVFDETLACGTGAVAAALTSHNYMRKTNLTVNTKGGSLQVSFKVSDTGYTDVFLTGGATLVFKGEISI